MNSATKNEKKQMALKDYIIQLSKEEYKALFNLLQEETMSSRISVYRWFSGKCVPSPIKQKIISKIIGIPADELFPDR